MILLASPGRLANALRDDTLAEQDKLRLLVAGLVVQSIFGSLGILYTWRSPPMLVASLLGLMITVRGARACYRENQRGDGARFIERVVCLSFPVGARVLTGSYAVSWAAAALLNGAAGWPPTKDAGGFWAQWVLVYLGASAFYWMTLRKHVATAATTRVM